MEPESLHGESRVAWRWVGLSRTYTETGDLSNTRSRRQLRAFVIPKFTPF